ncbi:PREDICTED: WAT1-related protein At4g08300 [Tarenaya hassleriana]|uniref:WAT1-related protein At4g08300 n=1 Tax=Tarenaya hassleriana TaxID=28532 RepID=UPI00053C4962|nr:PREDICTED: WAT1-related protein At4g08300 [Tarenaya hassleriana]
MMKGQRQCGIRCQRLEKLKPILAIISLQFGYAGMYIITMVSFKHGMNHWVLATYRHVVATVVMTPFALVIERKIRPKMTLPIFLRILALGLLEPVMDQNLYYMGMKATSATYTSAFVNALPAITFIMAVIFRLETVNMKKIHSLAKVVGTAITVGGAMVMTLYKGPAIQLVKSAAHSLHQGGAADTTDQHWVTGTLMVIGSIVSWAGFFILQSFTLKEYPAELSLVAWICFMGTILNAVVSLVMVRDISAWKVGMDSGTLAAVYSGVVCSGIAYYVQSIVIKERGPVFTTSFSPMCMIITAFLGALVLAETIHLGSIIGAVFIVFGLYFVVWGKSKDNVNSAEEKMAIQELPITNSVKQTNGADVTSAPAYGGTNST